MPILVTCECGRYFETPEINAGRRAKCPVCGHEMIVPVPQPAPSSEVVFITDVSLPTHTSGNAIASLVLGFLFFFFCLSGVPAILLGRKALKEIRESGGRIRGRRMAIAGIVLGIFGCLLTIPFFLPAIRSSREAARRAECTNNLKQIGLAMHLYHDANGCFPPAAIVDKDGRPLLSWRVAILAYIDSGALYAKLHLDEPWDSPHNRSLLEPTPRVYACPSDQDRKPGMTGYQAVIGPSTAFTPDFKPLKMSDFTDGLNMTLLVGESRQAVPWTKPEDVAFNMTIPNSGLGSFHGYHNNGFNVLMGDGAVRFIQRTIPQETLEAILTPNGVKVDGGSY
jgi:prepilin-type processing-associated H-X9-DG protein